MADSTEQGRPSWSRPPFEPGNTTAVTHGASSPRRVDEVAAHIEASARASAGWPGYLDGGAFASAVTDWARSEAVCELLWRWLSDQDDVGAMISDVTTEDSHETRTRGSARKVSRSTRVASVLDKLNTWQGRAAAHRSRLGLDPAGQARISKDLASTRYMAGLSGSHPLIEALDAKQRARELAARNVADGDGGGDGA